MQTKVESKAKSQDDALNNDAHLKAVEETVARRIADSILETRSYPYSSDVIDHIMPLRAYHDLVYDYEVNNGLRDLAFPTADGII